MAVDIKAWSTNALKDKFDQDIISGDVQPKSQYLVPTKSSILLLRNSSLKIKGWPKLIAIPYLHKSKSIKLCTRRQRLFRVCAQQVANKINQIQRQVRTHTDLQAFINNYKIPAFIVKTGSQFAQQQARVLLIQVRQEFIAVLIPQSHKIRGKAIAKVMNEDDFMQVKVLRGEDAIQACGYRDGLIPPLGLFTSNGKSIKCLIDISLKNNQPTIMQCGSEGYQLLMTIDDLKMHWKSSTGNFSVQLKQENIQQIQQPQLNAQQDINLQKASLKKVKSQQFSQSQSSEKSYLDQMQRRSQLKDILLKKSQAGQQQKNSFNQVLYDQAKQQTQPVENQKQQKQQLEQQQETVQQNQIVQQVQTDSAQQQQTDLQKGLEPLAQQQQIQQQEQHLQNENEQKLQWSYPVSGQQSKSIDEKEKKQAEQEQKDQGIAMLQDKEKVDKILSTLYTFKGYIRGYNKITEHLLMANLIPATTQAKKRKDAIYKYKWQNPVTMQPSKLQIIMGKVLQEKVGDEQCRALINSIRNDVQVEVYGKIQMGEHVQKSYGNATVYPDTFDIVCENVQIIGGPQIQIQKKPNKDQQKNKKDGNQYKLNTPQKNIIYVNDTEKILRMFKDILGSFLRASTPDNKFFETIGKFLGTDIHDVIGIDAEWQAFSLVQDATPVSILQIATLDKIYLIDMLQICQPRLLEFFTQGQAQHPIVHGNDTQDKVLASTQEDSQQPEQTLPDSQLQQQTPEQNLVQGAQNGNGISPQASKNGHVQWLDLRFPYDQKKHGYIFQLNEQQKLDLKFLVMMATEHAEQIHELRNTDNTMDNEKFDKLHPEIKVIYQLIDVDSISITSQETFIAIFLRLLLAQQDLLKVGVGHKYDIMRLYQSYPQLYLFPKVFSQQENILDYFKEQLNIDLSSDEHIKQYLQRDSIPQWLNLQSLAKNLLKKKKSQNLYFSSLQRLVTTVLGKQVDKEQQLSAWEKRPLTSEQLKYAATDVDCLIQILLKLNKNLSEITNEQEVEQCLKISCLKELTYEQIFQEEYQTQLRYSRLNTYQVISKK